MPGVLHLGIGTRPMTATESLILQELAAIRLQLQYLLVPAAKQTGLAMARMTDEERKAANKSAREEAKRRMKK